MHRFADGHRLVQLLNMVHASCLLYRILAAIANAFVKMARISGDSQILLIRHALVVIMAGISPLRRRPEEKNGRSPRASLHLSGMQTSFQCLDCCVAFGGFAIAPKPLRNALFHSGFVMQLL